MAPLRAERLASRGLRLPSARSEADQAAAAWACEMTALEQGAGKATLWLDFDQVLGDLDGSLRRMAQFFGFEASNERLSAIASGPLTRAASGLSSTTGW